jgi:rhodanese-related sulfurtransferase
MRRRIFLTLVAAALLGAPPALGVGAQEARPDRITLEEFKAIIADGKPFLALDVRGHVDSKIKGAKHVPLDALESRLAELPRDREIVTYCA